MSLRPDVKSLPLPELAARLAEWGEPSYRLRQLTQWLYERRAADWESMSNLSRSLRRRLAENFDLQSLVLERLEGGRQSTRKFLWRLRDGALIESVLIPANPALYGDSSDRHTCCVSTQVGCAYGCRFCASGLYGWQRNLTPDEIIEQVFSIERWNEAAGAEGIPGRAVNNLVIMGMGEPLANYDNLLTALRNLNSSQGGNIGARKITVSTSGLVPQILRLAKEPEQFRLAVSLHAATDEVRNRLMPVNRKYPLAMLVDACEKYRESRGKMITLEYTLLAGVNDGTDQILPLARLARRLHAKINLIPYNPVRGLPWKCPGDNRVQAFADALEKQRAAVTVRHEKGGDIDAACGQLRLKHLPTQSAHRNLHSPQSA